MHGDEGELEAAGEEAEHQQNIGAMAECLRQRGLERLLVPGGHVRPMPKAVSRSQATAARSSSIRKANTVSAACQPKLSIIATPNGANRNCPNEPAAVPAPSARPRFSGGSSLLKADSTRLNEQPDRPKPIRTPGAEIERTAASRHSASAADRRHRAARRRPSRAGSPKRSAMAPAIGWPSPHSRFCSASARPKTSRPQANSRLIGWMKKPRLERGPKPNSAIKHPQMMITSGVRQVARSGGRTDVAGRCSH